MARPTNRILRGLSVLPLTMAMATAFSVPAGATPIAEDHLALDRINAVRATAGACPIVLDDTLDVLADSWSVGLAAAGSLSHNIGALHGRQIDGENVSYASSPAAAHELFVNSAPHYANLVNDTYTSVGIGMVERSGRLYVTYDFDSVDGTSRRC